MTSISGDPKVDLTTKPTAGQDFASQASAPMAPMLTNAPPIPEAGYHLTLTNPIIYGYINFDGWIFTPPSTDGEDGAVLTTDGTGATSWQPAVHTLSFGTTGFYPNTPSHGDVVVDGILNISNGGTGGVSPKTAMENLLPDQSGHGGEVLSTDGSGNLIWIPGAGVGTVTSVDVSGGTTGLTTSGGPIIGAGVITLGGTLSIANGGTGATTANGAINALLPAQAGQNGKVLVTDGANVSWNDQVDFGVASFSAGTTGLLPNTATKGDVVLTGTLSPTNGGTGLTALGTGVQTGLGANVNGANGFVTYNGDLGTPTAATLTNATGLPLSTGVTGTLPASNGGTGLTSLGAGVSSGLGSDVNGPSGFVTYSGDLGTPTAGDFTTGSFSWPTFNQDTTGTAANVTGIVAIANGGTGENNAVDAANALLPNQAGQGGKYLTTDGAGNLSWGTESAMVYPSAGIAVSTGSAWDSSIVPGTGVANALAVNVGSSGSFVVNGGALGTPLSGNFSTGTFTWPTFNQNTTGTAANVSGVVAIANGGTGLTALGTGVQTALGTAPNAANGFVLYSGNLGTPTAGVLTNATGLPLNTGVTGVLGISNGGTGEATANDAFNALAPSQAGNNGKFLTTDGVNTSWATNAGGTVTSVDVSGGTTGLTTSGGPIITTGTITLGGTLNVANGGTGQTTSQAAMNAFAGAVTAGQYLRGNGTNVVMSAIQASDIPTLNQNTTGTAGNVTGTVAIANGGTGQTSANAAFNALAPSQASANGKFLTSNGTDSSWAAIAQMTYPGAGVAVSTGSAWGTSITLGTGVQTWLETPSSANLAAAVTDETGTGALVFADGATMSGTSFTGDITVNGATIGRGGADNASNFAAGSNVLQNNVSSLYSTGVGSGAIASVTTGDSNTAVGYSALGLVTTGYGNTAIGTNTLVNVDTGIGNVGLGGGAGYNITSGSNNTIIGQLDGDAAMSDTILIGAGLNERIRCNEFGQWLINTTDLPITPDIFLTVNGGIQLGTPNSITGALHLYNDSTTNSVTILSGVNNAEWVLTLPIDAGSAGQVLSTDGNGNTSWATAGGGSMVYPGAGLAVSTGTAWDTSITLGTGVQTALGNSVNGANGLLTVDATIADGYIPAATATGSLADSGKYFSDSVTSNQNIWSANQTQTAITTGLLNTPTLPGVRAATTSQITLVNTQTVDGVILSANDYVLVKNQTVTSQNGIYRVVAGTAPSGNWVRQAYVGGAYVDVTTQTTYADLAENNGIINVSQGTTNKNFQFQMTFAVPTATLAAGTPVYVTSLTKVPVDSLFSRYVDTNIGNDTLYNGTQSFPFATLSKAISGAKTAIGYPGVITIAPGNTDSSAPTWTSTLQNITVQSTDYCTASAGAVLTGTQTFATGSTRNKYININFQTGANAPFVYNSGAACRNYFQNLTINTTNTNWLGLNAGCTNWLTLDNIDFANFLATSVVLPSFSAAFTIYVTGQRRAIMRFTGTGAANTTINIDTSTDGYVWIPSDYLGSINWNGQAFSRTLGSTAFPAGVIGNSTDFTTITGWTADTTYDGWYAINFTGPSSFAKGAIIGKTTIAGTTYLYWGRTFAQSPATVSTLSGQFWSRNSSDWVLENAFGSFYDTTAAQTLVSAATEAVITMNNSDPANSSVSLVSGSQVTFASKGVYNLQYSIQFTNTSASIFNAYVWFRKNGTDIANTCSIFAVSPKHAGINGQTIAAVNLVLSVAAGDYIELVWGAEDTSVYIETIGAGTGPTRPASPGVIFTATSVA